MIAKEKEVAAIKALQQVMIRGRAMGYEKADHAKIADLMDYGPYALITYRSGTNVYWRLRPSSGIWQPAGHERLARRTCVRR